MNQKNKNTLTAIIIDETTTLSFSEVCKKYEIPEQLLIDLMEHGLFTPTSDKLENIHLDMKTLQRVESALRLHHDLGINTPGVVLALELIDEIEEIKNELDFLHRYFEKNHD